MTEQERISDLEGQLSHALARIAELELLLLKKIGSKNSKNSHTPPSADLSRKNKSLRQKSDKPPGGQKGHKGHTLQMSDEPDKTEVLYPSYCNRCGADLQGHTFSLQSRRQVIDTPPIIPQVTEYQCMGTVCGCGHHQCGTFPSGVDNHVQYGPNIQSLVIYQSYYQFLPFHRLSDFFSKICQVNISKGTIENIIRRNAHKAKPVYEKLQQAIAVSFFVGSDETGYKLKGNKGWFWVWQNALITFIVAATSRSKQVIGEYFPDGLPNAILCSDRLAAQLSTISKGSQLCLAHLLRDLNFLIERQESDWPQQFKSLLTEAITLKQKQPQYPQNDPNILVLEQKLDDLLNEEQLQVLLSDPVKHQNAITFFKQMLKLRNNLFPFLYHELVPFDNNGSERAIRMIKVKTKISGQFKSLHHEFAILRSVIDTTVKNGQSVFHAIHALVQCQPLAAG
jgi:transposase